ncbi:MAG: carbohydrate ABC transporter permease, partial [Candidatus Bathyarchaeia archaeon]
SLAQEGYWIPKNPTIYNYQVLFLGGRTWWGAATKTTEEFLLTIRNSILISLSTAMAVVLISSPAAYAITRFRFPLRDKLIILFLGTRAIPFVALVIPLFILMSAIKLTDTLVGLIIIYTSVLLPFNIFILTGAFDSVPRDLDSAALVDGCSWLGALFRVVLPCAMPGIVASVIYSFIAAWNSFFIPIIFTHSIEAKPFLVTIGEMITEVDVDYTLMSAGGVFGAIIPIILALIFQKYVVKGIAAGAVKR